MYCRNCGKRMETNDDFCMECKAAMFDKMQAQMKAQAPLSAQPEKQSEENPFAQSTYAPQTQAQPTQNPFAPPVQTMQYGASSNPFAPPVPTAENKGKSPRMLGFGRALTGAIMGFVGFIFATVALSYAAENFREDAITGYFLGLPAVVIAVVFGILSLVQAIRMKKQTDTMPIPGLVLGIVSLSLGGMTAFLDFITLLMLTSV